METIKRRRGKRRKTGEAAARPVVGYCRVSTTQQAEEGASLEAQAADIRAWAQRYGLTVAAIHSDVMSGARSDNRPGLAKAIAQACASGGVLVVASLSRVARSAADLHAFSQRLETCGAHMASAAPSELMIDTSTMTGELLFGIFATLAQWERKVTRERTRETVKHMRRQNRRISGRIPFGYDLADDGKTLTPNADEQATISAMQSQRASGGTYRAIVADLNGRGITAKQGGAWSPAVVADVLARAAKVAA